MKQLLFIIFIAVFLISLCMPESSLAQAPQQNILIGIAPEINIFKQKQRFDALGEFLSKKTGVTVTFTILSSYGEMIDNFIAGKIDGAFFSSFSGAIAIRRAGAVPLLRTVNLDGTSTYSGYIYVRKDSAIRSVKDMKNRRMAYVDKATTAGYLFPVAHLRMNGVADPERFFSETFFTGSHDAAINAVLTRKADVGAAKNTVYDLMRKRDSRVDRELEVIAESSRVPSNGLLVRKDLQESLKNSLKTVLSGLHTDSEGKAVLQQFAALKFIETTTHDYQSVFDMAKNAHIDVMTYIYRK